MLRQRRRDGHAGRAPRPDGRRAARPGRSRVRRRWRREAGGSCGSVPTTSSQAPSRPRPRDGRRRRGRGRRARLRGRAHAPRLRGRPRRRDPRVGWPAATYREIAEAGGGIVRSVDATRAAPVDAPGRRDRRAPATRCWRWAPPPRRSRAATGSATEAGAAVAGGHPRRRPRGHPVTVVPTFLGAHEVPVEHRADRERYVRMLVDEMIPEVARRGPGRASRTCSASRACSRWRRAGAILTAASGPRAGAARPRRRAGPRPAARSWRPSWARARPTTWCSPRAARDGALARGRCVATLLPLGRVLPAPAAFRARPRADRGGRAGRAAPATRTRAAGSRPRCRSR